MARKPFSPTSALRIPTRATTLKLRMQLFRACCSRLCFFSSAQNSNGTPELGLCQ